MNRGGSLRLPDRTGLLSAALVIGMFYAGSLRNTVVGEAYPDVGWLEVALDAVLIGMALVLLRRRGHLAEGSRLWAAMWPALPFIGLAACSLLWTIDRSVTLSRVLILILSTLLGMCLAVQFPLPRLMDLLAGYFAVLIVITVAVVAFLPNVGMMNFDPYTGSWRGLMWHRNYLGTAMALASLIFLCGIVRSFDGQSGVADLWRTDRLRPRLFHAVFYFAAVALVWLSQSATGVILLVLLHGGVVCVLLWLRWYRVLRPGHYATLATIAVCSALLTYVKRDALLGILGRNSTFTGRTGMWDWLFRYVVAQRPWLGHGFGALWNQNDFRLAVQSGVHWGFPVVIGDNGYVDIVLHLGYLGAFAFAILLTAILLSAVRLASRERTVLGFMPLLTLAYVLIVNITLSYFLETESYTWIIMIALWGAAALRLQGKAAEPLGEVGAVAAAETPTP